jgi:phage repressor protein C with HTH and peptisase S24 domain
MDHVIVSRQQLNPEPRLARQRPARANPYTLETCESQRTMRLDSYCSGVHTGAMRDVSAVARRLKQIRTRAGLSIRQVAESLGMEHGSSYQHYEDRFKKPLLPLDLILRLLPIFGPHGIDAADLFALAGVDGSGQRPLQAFTRPESMAPMMRIDELDVRASAGSGASGLTDETARAVAAWQIPNEIVRGYTTAPAAELRIITVLGDSMEPALLPGQRVLVDTADRRPSPPGVFVVWDGLGLVVKRVQLLPHTDPPRVKITSDNQNYEPYERTLDEAYIQGRVIGQWRWL